MVGSSKPCAAIKPVHASETYSDPLTDGAGIAEVVAQGRVVGSDGTATPIAIRFHARPGAGVTASLEAPPTEPLQPLDEYTGNVARARRRGLVYPYELAGVLTGPDGGFAIRNSQYAGFVPNGSSTNGNPSYGYAITEIRLEEFTAPLTNPPVLLDPRRLTNGSFQLTLSGVAGQKYAIDRSLNLSSWTNLLTFTNQLGQTLITDTNATGVNARFYRGRLVPVP